MKFMSDKFTNYSRANKEKWARVSPERRKEIMADLARKKWSSMTDKERKAHIKKMEDGKKLKANK